LAFGELALEFEECRADFRDGGDFAGHGGHGFGAEIAVLDFCWVQRFRKANSRSHITCGFLRVDHGQAYHAIERACIEKVVAQMRGHGSRDGAFSGS
jgi:hypothetical protein